MTSSIITRLPLWIGALYPNAGAPSRCSCPTLVVTMPRSCRDCRPCPGRRPSCTSIPLHCRRLNRSNGYRSAALKRPSRSRAAQLSRSSPNGRSFCKRRAEWAPVSAAPSRHQPNAPGVPLNADLRSRANCVAVTAAILAVLGFPKRRILARPGKKRVLSPNGHRTPLAPHEHPVVPPHVSHLRHVPLRTRVKLPHSPQASPS